MSSDEDSQIQQGLYVLLGGRRQGTLAGMTNPVRQRRFGRLMRHLREAAGLTLAQAGKRLALSAGMISYVEYGKRTLRPPDLKELLDAYGVDPARREMILQKAEDAKKGDWFSEYEDILSESYREYLALEDEASEINLYESPCVPGLLQIEAYARAILAPRNKDAVRLDKMVAQRMTRQSLLGRPEKKFHFIVDEPVLRRGIGGYAVLREQMRHLAEMAKLPNVTLQVLPHGPKAEVLISTSFVVLKFEDPGDVVFVENIAGGFYLDAENSVAEHVSIFEGLKSAALDPEASIRIIDESAKELDSLV